MGQKGSKKLKNTDDSEAVTAVTEIGKIYYACLLFLIIYVIHNDNIVNQSVSSSQSLELSCEDLFLIPICSAFTPSSAGQ